MCNFGGVKEPFKKRKCSYLISPFCHVTAYASGVFYAQKYFMTVKWYKNKILQSVVYHFM